jgi:hypothetical protein
MRVHGTYYYRSNGVSPPVSPEELALLSPFPTARQCASATLLESLKVVQRLSPETTV